MIVDDDEEIRTQMKWALSQDYDVFPAEDRIGALEIMKEHRPPVVLLDLGLPPNPSTPEEGLAALPEMLSMDQFAKIIIISGQGEKKNALLAIGSGAYDFLIKPIQLDELKIILRRTFHVAELERDFRDLQSHIQTDTFEGLLGASPQIQQIFSHIRKAATTDAPILILGESGTGKEMAALAIHRRSQRKDASFVAINCSAIPEALLESELFGHEKGSFTGAHMQRKGRIETASGGTLFLDEIGEIPLQLQVKLLRFLQEQSIERVGGRQEVRVDTRVVAATNVDLKKAISDGRFREDLYYRLAVVTLKLPPLRDRPGDIRLLAQEFLRRNANANGKDGLAFSQDAVKALNSHTWPGNVRELENRVKRAVIMSDGKKLSAQDLELESSSAGALNLNLKDARECAEREVIQKALRKHAGKIAPAAADMGISRPTLYELMEKLGIAKLERDGKPGEAGENS